MDGVLDQLQSHGYNLLKIPYSNDTGGLLQDDWYSWQTEKQQMLNRIIQ